jgi:iron complex outermembrane receptor protein
MPSLIVRGITVLTETKKALLAGAMISVSLTAAHASDLSGEQPSAAPEAPSAGDGPASDGSQLEDIVVTATRQKRSLQDIPVSVNVVAGEQLMESGYKNPSDLQFLSPSIQVASAGGVGFSIRGVGTQSNNLGNEQAVGTVVDGVTYGFNNDTGLDFTGVDQIEILRGPQSTTFGKSSTAGVINITTVRPKLDALTADAQVSYGTYRDTNSYAQVNVPISSTLAAYFSGAFKNRDGFLYNPVLKKTLGDIYQVAGRAKLLWEPSDDLSVYFNSDYRYYSATPNFFATWESVGPLKGSGILDYGIVPGPRNTEIGDSTVSYRHVSTGGGSIQIDKGAGDLTLTSITALRYLNVDLESTRNDTPIIYLNDHEKIKMRQISQEFRVASPTTGAFQYLAGLYFYNRTVHDNLLTSGPYNGLAEATFGPGALVSNAGGRQFSTNNVLNLAAYANVILEVTDKLKLNGGVRFTYDRSKADVYLVPEPGVYLLPGAKLLTAQSLRVSDTNISYRFGPQYFINPDVQLYATVSRGYKGAVAAVINAVGTQSAAPESVQAYEVGLKATLFDRHVIFNINAFHQHYKDFQTSVLNTNLTPAAFVLGNAGGMTAKGVEANISIRPVANLTINGAVTYQDATYTDFAAPCYVFQPTTTDPSGVGGCYKIPGTNSTFTQAAGSPLQNASKWNLTFSANYTHPLTSTLNLDFGINNVYRTKFATTGYNPNTFINGYNVTGVNIGLEDADKRWRLAVFSRNLFDHYYRSARQQATFDTGGYTQVVDPEARRTIGVQFNYHYF